MKYVFYLSFILCFTSVLGQSPVSESLNKEKGGRLEISQSREIKGTDFIYDEWNKGILVLNDSVFSKQDYLKYDTYKDRVLIKNMNNISEVIEIKDKSFTGFSIIEGKKNIKHDFVKIPSENFKDEDQGGFYEIVFNKENTNYFIKKNSKVLYDPNRSKGTQTINNYPLEYRDIVEYYIKNNEGLYVNVKLKKKDIKSILTNHSQDIDFYIKANKIKFSKENDVMKLINYYYSL
ncbi:hypothetical protein [Lutibacter sp. B1]|uniref:hypothetical protein n=1 Tax=Lutibacter sp. B1 TaxID=2725996 RepID=UPI00145704E9|nr:hypothetical protein [Lutibacter sp. B1]NLP58782.1 hypothetical protein [Lutibacter sp. B1]